MSEKVLIVEDDPALLRGIADNFAFRGYGVDTASDGETGLEKALRGRADLIVLDVMLPGVNGYEICRCLRREGIQTPTIFLTAKSEESDVLLGLGLGGLVGGRYAARVRNGFKVYGWIELGIGLYALGVPTLLGLFPSLNHWLLGSLSYWPAVLARLWPGG